MSQDLEKAVKVHVAEIQHHGEKIILPSDMNVSDAIKVLKRREKYLEEETSFSQTFDAFPWDGANALAEVMRKKYGWLVAERSPTMFGTEPPKLLNIEVGPNVRKQIPWGRVSIPGASGYLDCGYQKRNGRFVFALSAVMKRHAEDVVLDIFTAIEDELRTNSIYAGKAIKIRFRDDDGDLLSMPEPKFIDVSKITRDSLIYSRDVEEAIETNLFTPIERVQDCIDNGINIKRGVLLGGPYGTGKTLAATVASSLAVQNGVTYIYVPRADELADALAFASLYDEKACVVFCEDIDRTTSGNRSVRMDDILNIIDGIETKSSRIITVLTTNHLENINPAMLRPGRLDAIINVTPPDSEAAERLIRFYGGESLDPKADLTGAAKLLDGAIPAVIAETMKRAKLAQLSLQGRGEKISLISGQAVLRAAESMQDQIELLKKQSEPKEKPVTIDQLVGQAVSDAASHPHFGRSQVDLAESA